MGMDGRSWRGVGADTMPALPWGVLPAEHLEALTPHEPNPESEEVWRLAQGAEQTYPSDSQGARYPSDLT